MAEPDKKFDDKKPKKAGSSFYIFSLILIAAVLSNYLGKPGGTSGTSATSTAQSTTSQASTDATLQKLFQNWKATQAKFVPKAGESGTYNLPDKVQFISADTMIVHYDDGLADHTSLVRYKNGSFVQLKSVADIGTITKSQWQTLVDTYGNSAFQPVNYRSVINGSYTRVTENVFLK